MKKNNQIIDNYIQEHKFHKYLHKAKKILIIFPKFTFLVVIALFAILTYKEKIALAIEFLSFLVILISAIFAFDHLYHVKSRNMMKILEDMNNSWNSFGMLVSRKNVIDFYKKDSKKLPASQEDRTSYVAFKLKLFLLEQKSKREEQDHLLVNDNDCSNASACVANFFEEIGYILKKNIIDIDFINQMYGDAILSYFDFLKEFLEQERKKIEDNDVYSNFYNMCEAIKEFRKNNKESK